MNEGKLERLLSRHSVPRLGALHAGAHLGQEAEIYQRCGFQRVLWIEGNPDLFPRLEAHVRQFPNQSALCVLVSDVDRQSVPFHVTNNDGASSSMLEFDRGLLAKSYPGLDVERSVDLEARRLDAVLSERGVDASKFSFLNLDLQGAELLALRGMGGLVDHFDMICTEVNLGRLYRRSALLHEIDEYVGRRGFTRVGLSVLGVQGQAYYVRRGIQHPVARHLTVVSALAVETLYRAGIVDFLLRRVAKRDLFPYSILRAIYRAAVSRDH